MAYRHGSWNVICDRCGWKYKSSQLRREWTGYRVCSGGGTNNCWEPRHPQDYVRGRVDNQMPPWVRPEPVVAAGALALEGSDGLLLESGDRLMLES